MKTEIYSNQDLLFDRLRKNASKLTGINIGAKLLELKSKNGKVFSIPIKNITTHWDLKNKEVSDLLSTKQGRSRFMNDYNRCLSYLIPNFK